MKKLNAKGFSHWILPVAAVVVIAGVGAYVLTKSKAYMITNGSVSVYTPYSCTTTPTLRKGSTGNCVKTLQYFMNNWIRNTKAPYAQLLVDGQFGTKTDAVVRAYQKSKGLYVDGVVGPKTWGVILTDRNAIYTSTSQVK